MNGKLIAMLIRSNALMIEALKMADANARVREGGPCCFGPAEFDNLVTDCELLAKEAEEYTGNAEIQQAMPIAASEGAMHGFSELNKWSDLIIPFSPAHKSNHAQTRNEDVVVGRKFTGRLISTSTTATCTYLAVITDIDVNFNIGDMDPNIRATVFSVDDKKVAAFTRSLPAQQFKKEFLCWIE